MENTQILLPLNKILSVKSAAILRTVSKICKNYIKVKNYSFYKIFKQLDLSIDSVIKMVFETDQDFITEDEYEDYFLSIKNHKFGDKLKELVLNSKYFYCLEEFSDFLIDYGENLGGTVEQYACEHCLLYTNYKPLQGLLIELCIEKE